MFSEISELKTIREQKRRLSEREAELSNPILSDLNFIPKVYQWFNEISENRDCPPRRDSVRSRKQFIFIILFLYSPSVLAGGKMPKGLRKAISDAVNLHSESTVSDNCADVVFLYQNYKDFRRDIDYVYNEIIDRLKVERGEL